MNPKKLLSHQFALCEMEKTKGRKLADVDVMNSENNFIKIWLDKPVTRTEINKNGEKTRYKDQKNSSELKQEAKKLADYPTRLKTKILIEKARSQMDAVTPDHEFMFAIFEHAVRDAYFPRGPGSQRGSAIRYLLDSDMENLEIIGVEAEWIRQQIKRLNIMPTEPVHA